MSEPSLSVDDAEGKVAAVSSAHDPMAAIGQLWFLFLDAVLPELRPAVAVAGMLRAVFDVPGVDGGGGWRG